MLYVDKKYIYVSEKNTLLEITLHEKILTKGIRKICVKVYKKQLY